MTGLLPLSILLPLAGAGLILAWRRSRRAAKVLSVAALSAQLVTELGLLIFVDAHGPVVMHIGGWAAPVGISLVADRFASILMVVSSIVALAVLVYAISQQRRRIGREGTTTVFYPAMLIMAAGVSNAFVAGDLFNLFVSFEILLTASYVLLTLGGTIERIRAGAPYLVVSLLSSIIFLSAIALVYAATGTVNLAQLSLRIGGIDSGAAHILQALLLVAFGIKAAVWPMSAWLPDSYPNAPAPVTAVFAGLLTKVGIYAIIRTQTVLFGGSGFTDLLMWAALATMLVGIAGAIAQSDIKRMLSFTLVSHIGYMLFGVALGSQESLAATVYYVVHHIVVQTGLFLAAGLIEYLRGTTVVTHLGGLARQAPLLAIMFFVTAMNLGGIPPLSGFVGKIGLFAAGFHDGGSLPIAVVIAGSVTSLATLYAVVRIWGRAFWRPTPLISAGPSAPTAAAESAAAESVEAESVQALGAVETELRTMPTATVARARGTASPQGAPGRGPRHVLPAERLDDSDDAEVSPLHPRVGRTIIEPPEESPAGVPTVAEPPTGRAHVLPAKIPRGMVGATAAIVAVGIMLSVAGGPLYGLAGRAAADLHAPDRYISMVLGDGS